MMKISIQTAVEPTPIPAPPHNSMI